MADATREELLALEHSTNCPERNPMSDDFCTCGFIYRKHLQTEQTMHAAWRKRAEEAEASAELLRDALRKSEQRELKALADIDNATAETARLLATVEVMRRALVAAQEVIESVLDGGAIPIPEDAVLSSTSLDITAALTSPPVEQVRAEWERLKNALSYSREQIGGYEELLAAERARADKAEAELETLRQLITPAFANSQHKMMIENLTMFVRRLYVRLRKHEPDAPMIRQANTYLKAIGQAGTPLRAEEAALKGDGDE